MRTRDRPRDRGGRLVAALLAAVTAVTRRALLGAVVAGFVAAAVGCGGEVMPGKGAFDGVMAESLVASQVGFGARVPGTEAHAMALEWMTAYLRERADSVAQVPFTHVTARGDTLELTNVWASFLPSAPSRILLTAHWDSRPVAEQA